MGSIGGLVDFWHIYLFIYFHLTLAQISPQHLHLSPTFKHLLKG